MFDNSNKLKIITPLWRVPDWFPKLDKLKLEKLKKLHQELLRFNKVINLISPRTTHCADAIHFADSIHACLAVLKDSNSRKIYDIGTGNGFPGLVLSILDESRVVVLLDSDMRKMEFIKHIIQFLNLKNTKILHGRVEDLEKGSIDCAISRAFAPIQKSIEYTFDIINNGGSYYHLKSESWILEMTQMSVEFGRYWDISQIAEYNLEGVPAKKFVICLKKH